MAVSGLRLLGSKGLSPSTFLNGKGKGQCARKGCVRSSGTRELGAFRLLRLDSAYHGFRDASQFFRTCCKYSYSWAHPSSSRHLQQPFRKHLGLATIDNSLYPKTLFSHSSWEWDWQFFSCAPCTSSLLWTHLKKCWQSFCIYSRSICLDAKLTICHPRHLLWSCHLCLCRGPRGFLSASRKWHRLERSWPLLSRLRGIGVHKATAFAQITGSHEEPWSGVHQILFGTCGSSAALSLYIPRQCYNKSSYLWRSGFY